MTETRKSLQIGDKIKLTGTVKRIIRGLNSKGYVCLDVLGTNVWIAYNRPKKEEKNG